MTDEERLRTMFGALAEVLDERTWRLTAAAAAQAWGHGGLTLVSRAVGIAKSTLQAGIKELAAPPPEAPRFQRIRREGGGRTPLLKKDPTLLSDLEALVDKESRGDPQSPLRWTSKSLRQLAKELQAKGHQVSFRLVRDLLRRLGFSLQSTRKTQEGTSHPDRDAQFGYLQEQVSAFQERQAPVVSVDTKKKELVGPYAKAGKEWQKKKEPEEVRVHDFPDEELGKAIPYGVYDLTRNEGWVSVGIDHDTAAFAAATLRRWWEEMGNAAYPEASELLVTCDGGGSNSSRGRLWKVALQEFADQTGLTVTVAHLPPGTSKWNKIEHRMFSQITKNWRGRPLISLEVIVSLIADTRTEPGLSIRAALDEREYPTKRKISDEELARVKLTRADFHGDWNYTIAPHTTTNRPS
jgi:hypothetical protein